MYAIVKAGGRQEKVAVGDTITVDRIDAAVGASVNSRLFFLLMAQRSQQMQRLWLQPR